MRFKKKRIFTIVGMVITIYLLLCVYRSGFISSMLRGYIICSNIEGTAYDIPRKHMCLKFWKTSEDVWYYSSFHGVKNNIVNIHGIRQSARYRSRVVLFCQFGIENGSVYKFSTKASQRLLPENRGKRYGAAYFTCAIPHGIKPYAVSLVAEKCEKPSNFIPIQYPEKQKWQFTVCVTPFNYRYSKAYELVEMIELNRILGADQIVFYNYTTHHNVDKVLQHYIDQGVVQVVQWHLPMKVDTWPKIKGRPVEIHYFGQLAALNDCLYRNRYRSRYLVYQDLDEFIVPHKHANWKDMVKSVGEDRGVYMFRNVFFRKEWNDTTRTYPGKDIAKKYKAVTLLKLRREDKIYGPRHRSKYILNPKLVDIVGIHNIWKAKEGGLVHHVSPDIALLHHYRNWENPTDPIKRIDDDTVLKFKDKLVARLNSTWGKLPGVPLGPL